METHVIQTFIGRAVVYVERTAPTYDSPGSEYILVSVDPTEQARRELKVSGVRMGAPRKVRPSKLGHYHGGDEGWEWD